MKIVRLSLSFVVRKAKIYIHLPALYLYMGIARKAQHGAMEYLDSSFILVISRKPSNIATASFMKQREVVKHQ